MTAPPVIANAVPGPTEQQRNERLLTGLVLGMLIIFGSLDAVSVVTIPGYAVPWMGYVSLLGALVLNRLGYYRAASTLLILLVPLVVVGTWDMPRGGSRALYYLVFTEMVASLLLGFRATLLVALGCIAAIVFAGTLAPGATGFANVRGPFVVVAISAVLLLVTRVHRDRIERDREDALRAGVERYRALFNNVPVALAEQDFSEVRRFLDDLQATGVSDLRRELAMRPERFEEMMNRANRINVNDRWVEKFGGRVGELTARWGEGGALTLRQSFSEIAIALLESGREVEREIVIEVAPGERRFLDVRWTVRTGAELTWDRVLISAVDVTEPRRAQEALRVNEARMTAIVETALDPIISMDHRGNAVGFNPAAERLFGYTQEEVLGKSLGTLIVPPAHRDAHQRGMQRFLATGDARMLGRRVELSAMRADGSEFPIELAITVSTLEDPPTFTAHVRDLTERAAAEARHSALEQQLRQAQKMEAIGQLAGGVAHDFNNNLQAVSGYLSFAVDEAAASGSTELLADLREAQFVVSRSAELTRQLLAFSRRQTLNLKTAPLDDLLVPVLKLLRRVLGEHVELRYRPTNGLPPVRVDAGQLEQAVLNLCLNARDAMPNGGTLTLVTELAVIDASQSNARPALAPGAYVALEVRDNGSGMDADVQSRMFEPFFTTKESGRGTGLGLAVVYGVVEQHQGVIEVDSTPGVGTTFRIYLPVSGDPPLTPVSEAALEARYGHETILVADDDQAIRTIVERCLRSAGYRVYTAASGTEAESVYRAHADEIALVLLDAVMPGQSGRVAYEKMAELRPGLPVIFCSGYSQAILDPDWLASVGADLLNKPFERAQLLHRIREVLDAAATRTPA